MINKSDLLAVLEPFPVMRECFSKYIDWVCANVKDRHDEYPLIKAISGNDVKKLGDIEKLLKQSRDILEISTADFCRAFGFWDDLLVQDPKKIHDILAEPLFIIDLRTYGFSSIQKLRHKAGRNPLADFTAYRGGLKFAIELKTVRTESAWGNQMRSAWWQKMWRNNAITKIEDKNRRVLKQLEHTRRSHNCDRTMLVIYSRRLGPGTLMDAGEYQVELKNLNACYPEIDFFCCKDYYASAVEFYPQLPPVI